MNQTDIFATGAKRLQMTDSIELTIQSAVANLIDQNDDRVDVDTLVVQTIQVDEAPFLKRFIPVSRGRAHPILKRSSHLTVVVGTPAGAEA